MILVYAILAVHFLLVFGLLSLLILVDYHTVSFGIIFMALYSLLCALVTFISIYPIWSTRLKPKVWALSVSVLLIGYSSVWFYLGPAYVVLAFLFFILGVVNGLYVMTGQAASEYYSKDKKSLY